MAKLGALDKAYSLQIRGIIGRPNTLGNFWPGWSVLGDSDTLAGIYRKRPTKKGETFIKMKHYLPDNPRSDVQQAWRNYFAQIMSIWHAVDESERVRLRQMKYPRGMGGFNRYIRAYMRRKPTDVGNTVLGMSALGNLDI